MERYQVFLKYTYLIPEAINTYVTKSTIYQQMHFSNLIHTKPSQLTNRNKLYCTMNGNSNLSWLATMVTTILFKILTRFCSKIMCWGPTDPHLTFHCLIKCLRCGVNRFKDECSLIERYYREFNVTFYSRVLNHKILIFDFMFDWNGYDSGLKKKPEISISWEAVGLWMDVHLCHKEFLRNSESTIN